MYADVKTALFDGTDTGALDVMIANVGDMFETILPVALPVLGGIALGFFAIKVVRAILHI